jgi:hypothetical protein
LLNGTSLYKSGENILIDNNVTWNLHEFYSQIALPFTGATPENARNIRGELLPASS